MIGTILLTIIGCEVFPEYFGWWIFYCVVGCFFRLIQLGVIIARAIK